MLEITLQKSSNKPEEIFCEKSKYVSKDVANTTKNDEASNLLKTVEKERVTTKKTNDMIAIAYQYAKKVYFGELTLQEGKVAIARVSGMNEGSAQDYITDFLAMMEGKEYQRVISNFGTAFYLENIRKDFGEEAFKKAIEATEKHITYYNQLGYGLLKQKEKLVNRYKELLKEKV